jgi:hypothetical protein
VNDRPDRPSGEPIAAPPDEGEVYPDLHVWMDRYGSYAAIDWRAWDKAVAHAKAMGWKPVETPETVSARESAD